MSVGILGAGFGLYGYLPALATRLQERVILPARYRDTLLGRGDIAALDAFVDWARDDQEVLRRSTGLILAKRPADQGAWVRAALEFPNIERFLLEKPIACDPPQSAELLDVLEASKKFVRVGFVFRFTDWAKALAASMAQAEPQDMLSFNWHFQAHHYVMELDTWKRWPSQGGGVLRFYGIHLVALLAEWGYSEAELSLVSGASADDAADWQAVLTGEDLPSCQVQLRTNAPVARFEAGLSTPSGAAIYCHRLQGPFDGVARNGGFDSRVALLSELCGSFLKDLEIIPNWYRKSVALWRAVEDRTRVARYSITR